MTLTTKQGKMKLLVVDDDDVDREKIRRMLKSVGVESEIEESANLSDTMSILSDNAYDCVIVDYRLGPEDGFDVLNAIRQNFQKQCAVIMVTGLGDEEIAAEALRLGANDYLVKNKLQAPKLLKAVLGAVHQSELENKIHELAHHDILTGLVSRTLLTDRIQQVIAQIGRSNKVSALAFIDLDNFKPINDHYGHEAGDIVLKETASRLRQSIRDTDTASRIGGDEFVLVLSGFSKSSECEDLLKRILLKLGVPVAIPNNCSVKISASVGIALITDNNVDAETLLRRADQAMYQAKNSGKNKVFFFDPKEETKQKLRRELLSNVENGINNNQFLLHYQPKINMITGQCIGVEALIRWNHPEKGLLSPLKFEEALLHSSLGVSIGEWVIEEAIRQHISWLDKDIFLPISVNISPFHIHCYEFISNLDHMIEKYDLDSINDFLEFEVLESISLKDIAHAANVLNQCKKRGIKISLDDFGTGYASLKYLKSLPLDTLKIDKSFIQNIEENAADIAIVKSIIDLSHNFQYQLVAEGIETKEQAHKLIELGCFCMQGYLISHPITADNIETWITNTRFYVV